MFLVALVCLFVSNITQKAMTDCNEILLGVGVGGGREGGSGMVQ